MSDGPFGLTPSGSTSDEPDRTEPNRTPVPAEAFGFGAGALPPAAPEAAGVPSIADPGSVPEPTPTEAISVREGARERAREIRELHRKQDRRRRRIVVGSVVGGIVAIVAIVAVVLVAFAQPTGRGPLNMMSDGIKIGAGYKAVTTGGIPVNSRPVPSATNSPNVIDIQLYVDYLCPNCGVFEKKNDAQLRAWVKSGAATIEIHPIAVLTTKSAGTQYSMRAANAAACVAEFSPDHFFEFNEALFVDQPKEGTPGLDDTTLGNRAAKAGVTDMARVRDCIQDHRFRTWVQEATTRALDGPIPNSDLKAIAGTPTVIVNGTQFKYTSAFDPNEFAQFVLQVAGDAFTKNPSQSPTPTPSATPSAG
ncbi:MAG TPA: thioredoxin domain-containing protein [Pseudolysinimonas sp.]|jgi:protein-disulfide isomerase